jgi:hypothetical protein
MAWCLVKHRDIGFEMNKENNRFSISKCVKILPDWITYPGILNYYPEDGGSKLSRNVCILPQQFTPS